MLNIFARSFLEATRTPRTPRLGQWRHSHQDEKTVKREQHARLWLRRPYWL